MYKKPVVVAGPVGLVGERRESVGRRWSTPRVVHGLSTPPGGLVHNSTGSRSSRTPLVTFPRIQDQRAHPCPFERPAEPTRRSIFQRSLSGPFPAARSSPGEEAVATGCPSTGRDVPPAAIPAAAGSCARVRHQRSRLLPRHLRQGRNRRQCQSDPRRLSSQ